MVDERYMPNGKLKIDNGKLRIPERVVFLTKNIYL